jgi:RNA polymerase primary sigma factor
MPAKKRAPQRDTKKPSGPARVRELSADTLTAYLRAISRYQPLSLEREQELGRRIRVGDQEALDMLVEANLRFVVSYAKRYRGLGLSFLDLIHEGNLGLIEAARRFDPDRNVKFISYAVWWIRQSIFHSLSAHSRIFRLPQKMSGQVSRISNARERLAGELARPPTTAELARRTELTEAEVEALLLISSEDLSLSTAVGDDGNVELGDTLEQASIPSVELEMIRNSFVSKIQEMVDDLDEKERSVIRMRFGFDGEEPRTLQEIGEALHLSRERIRQIEAKAKEKLRRSHAAQGLRGYLN